MMRKLCRRKSILIFLAVLLVLSLFPFDQIRAVEPSDPEPQIESSVEEKLDMAGDNQNPDDEDGNEGGENLPDEGQNEGDDLGSGAGGNEEGDPDASKEDLPDEGQDEGEDLEPGAGENEEGDPDAGKEEQPGGDEKKACELTDGCTLLAKHKGACVIKAINPADKEEQPDKDNQEKCELTSGCMLLAGHKGDCVMEEPCDLMEGCTLLKGHKGDCIVEDMEIEEIGVQELEGGTITIKPLEDKISAYFGEELKAKVSVFCPMNAKNFFFLKMDTDRAGLVSVEDAEELSWTETEGGYYFTLDNENEDAAAEFVLTFKSDEVATAESSNPAKVLIYAGNGVDQDEAEEAAETAYEEQKEELEFTWSASSDKLQYSIDLYWKTADESQKYEQSIDTVKRTTIDITYVLNIITSSGTYPTGSMEVRIPYALWAYRDGKSACIPSQISIPEKPGIPADEDIRYHYYVDDKGTSDQTDDELVITNWCEVSAGTDTTIEVKYTIDPVKTIDMSKAELVAKGTATTTLQENAETHESNAITFQLDTGIVCGNLSWKEKTCFYEDEIIVDGKTLQLDTKNYRYMLYKFNDIFYEQNQDMDVTYTFSDELCEEAEVIRVNFSYYPSTGGIIGNFFRSASCKERNQWSCFWNDTRSKYTGDGDILVRYPLNVTSYKPMIIKEAVASDEDSHSEEDGDHNDLASGKLVTTTPIEWKDYDYQIGNLESWSKTGESTVSGGVELLEAGESIEMKWSVSQSYNGNLLPEGTKQKFEIYDDFHFWNMGENGAYIPMTEEDYEITDVSGFSITYSGTNTKNGKVSYPDYEGGTIVIEGYRNGVWETIGTAAISERKNKNSQYLTVKSSVNSMEGMNYTRVRAITPEFGTGEVKVSFSVTSKIKADSPAVKENAERELKTSQINVENWAAFKHFTTDEDGNNYQWDDGNGEYKIVGSYTKSNVSYLEERDKAEQNYGEGDDGSYMLRACRSGKLTGAGGKSSSISKKTGKIVNDSKKQRVDVTFSVSEYEQWSASEELGKKLPDYMTEFQQTEGVFYDLLPEGYHYNTESEPVAYGVYGISRTVNAVAIIEDVTVVDNWNGTGREMVIFKVCKENSNYIYSNWFMGEAKYGSTKYWWTGFQITFDTYITWKDLVYTTGKSVNLVAFQSGKTISGSSMSDNGIPGTGNTQLVREFSYVTGRDGNSAFYDMDGDGVITDNSTLYAYSEVSIDAATAIEVGIDKRVKGNGGIYTTEDTTSLNDTYKYRVGVTNSASGTLKDLIVYDILEDAANKEGATGEVTWKGTYKDIDLSRAVALGVKPVVYYSTVKGLDYNEKTGDQKDQWLEDTTVWSIAIPADKSKITAVAVDLRKKTDGTDFELPNNGCVFFEISMTAPENLPQLEDPAMVYAINRPAYSCYRQTKTSATGEYATVIGTRVKIRIEETSRSVEKKWDDGANLDKSRPSQIQVQLFADGEPYGEAVILKEADSWSYTWEHLPKTAIGGTEIVWSVEEMEVPDGYSAEVEEMGNKFIITNSHTPVPTPEPTLTPTPEPTPGVTPETTPGSGTPTPEATPEPTLTPTPAVTPEVTPEPDTTPEATPETTPEGGTPTPEATPEVTPETTPEGGTPTPEATPETTPENTSTPQPTPAPTPDFWEEVPPEPVEEINPENGINVPETGIHAAVLGVRRATDCAVLGKRRRPETGDSMQLFIWLGILAAAGAASFGAGAYLRREKKKGIKEDE